MILSISDQGNGIDREQLTKIFQPFFTTKEGGIGLGLAVCKKLCLENQATIMLKIILIVVVLFILSKRCQGTSQIKKV